MSDNIENVVENAKQRDTWVRALFMIGFSAVLYIVIAPVIFVLMIAQFAFVLFTGELNRNLQEFSEVWIRCISQALRFMTYNSDTKPYPFSDLPHVESDVDAKEQSTAQTAPPKSVTKPPTNSSTKSAEMQTASSASEETVESAAELKPATKKTGKKSVKKAASKKAAVEKVSALEKASKPKAADVKSVESD